MREPNGGHLALVELERQGRLRAVVTQNIDELHQRAGHRAGERDRGARHDALEPVLDVRRPPPDGGDARPGARRRGRSALPRAAGGILKSDTISFGQSLVPEVIDAAMRAADECDVLLAVGSTLTVFPAANVVPRAKASGARVVIVNAEPTAMDRFADVVAARIARRPPARIDRPDPVAKSRPVG